MDVAAARPSKADHTGMWIGISIAVAVVVIVAIVLIVLYVAVFPDRHSSSTEVVRVRTPFSGVLLDAMPSTASKPSEVCLIPMFPQVTQMPAISDPQRVFPSDPNVPVSQQPALQLERGLYLVADLWREVPLFVNFQVSVHDAYQLTGLPELEDLIRRLHRIQNPNADFDKKILIMGIGATQVLHSVLFAIYTKLQRRVTITVRTPGYLDIPDSLPFLHQLQATYKPDLQQADVEFIASPNNPDGRLLTSQGKDILYNVYDRVNFWPFYLQDVPNVPSEYTFQDEDITVFSLPKFDGMSGSRLGYAFLRDPELAAYARMYPVISTHGLSVDAELRHITILRYLLQGNNYRDYVNRLLTIMIDRWNKLTEELKSHTDVVLHSQRGPNAWVATPGKTAMRHLLQQYNITATYGPEYGASPAFARLDMLCTEEQFNELIFRLQTYNPDTPHPPSSSVSSHPRSEDGVSSKPVSL